VKIICFCVLLIGMFTANVFASEFCDGFDRGYIAGRKYSFTYPCPAQPFKSVYDRSDYEHGYIIGYEKGKKDWTSNNKSSTPVSKGKSSSIESASKTGSAVGSALFKGLSIWAASQSKSVGILTSSSNDGWGGIFMGIPAKNNKTISGLEFSGYGELPMSGLKIQRSDTANGVGYIEGWELMFSTFAKTENFLSFILGIGIGSERTIDLSDSKYLYANSRNEWFMALKAGAMIFLINNPDYKVGLEYSWHSRKKLQYSINIYY
jgi:hypothetical protein